jgi:hypothetical protein
VLEAAPGRHVCGVLDARGPPRLTTRREPFTMNRFLPQVVCGLCLLVGLSVGWYADYTRPSVRGQRKLLKEYQTVRDAFRLTDEDMAKWGGRIPEFFDSVRRQDETAAAMGLAALVRLEKGDTESARNVLQKTISIYYRSHRDDGNTNLLKHITNFAATNASLSNAIYRPLESLTNR